MRAHEKFTVPQENSYWVVPGILLAGEYPRTQEQSSSIVQLESMLFAGITRFIDLTTSYDNLDPYDDMLEELAGKRAKRLLVQLRMLRVARTLALSVAG